ncbi:Rossmann-fold NAD(P)-binding domain-containing protein [Hirschia baltica]|nr:hypothetical protein [Hirschia baltica]
MDQLHRSLGIAQSHMQRISKNKTPIAAVQLSENLRLPFWDYGAPLKGVPFYHIWLREHLNGGVKDLRSFNPSFAPVHRDAGYWEIDPSKYEELLRSISAHAGIGKIYSDVEQVSCDEQDLIIETQGGPIRQQLTDCLRLGNGRFPTVSITNFDLMVMQRNLLALVQNFPQIGSKKIERQELEEELNSVLASVEDMQFLMSADFDTGKLSERVKYRIELWLDVGRVIPCEGDLFLPHEWLAVLHKRVGPPMAYSRLVDSISRQEASAHLQKYQIDEGI